MPALQFAPYTIHLDEPTTNVSYTIQMDAIASTIRAARREKKLSQQDLADRHHMSRNTISGIENNTIPEIGIRKVEAILNGLGYTLTVRRLSGRPTLDDLIEDDSHD